MKAITIILGLLLLNVISVSAQELHKFADDQLIIKFKSIESFDYQNCLLRQKFNNKIIDDLNKKHSVQKIKPTGNRKDKDTYVLIFNTPQDIKSLVREYQETGLFEFVEPNYIGEVGAQKKLMQTFPNETLFSRQYSLYNDGTFALSTATVDADIDMELAWDIEKGDSTIIVAVLDSGIKTDHPDFAGRLWKNSSEIANGNDDDGNGFIDDIDGWDFANDDNDPTDDHGHGTNVAGIIGAKSDNTIGYAGVDWNCKIMTCKVISSSGSGLYTWWADAVYYAVDNGARVINMSLGGSSASSVLSAAIAYAEANNVTVVVSMMNFNSNVPYVPAAYPSTIAVGSTNPNDERSVPFFWSTTSGSSYGAHIDVVAPGNYIYGLDYNSNTNYGGYWGGTSQAAPHVAGLCALLLAQDPSRTPTQLRTIIRNTAEDQVGLSSEDTPGFDNYYGYGRINAHHALLELLSSVEIENKEFHIFPNPTNKVLAISLSETGKKIYLYDINGRLVLEEKMNGKTAKLNVENLDAGSYFLKIELSNNKKPVSKKLSIQ
jgi:subtilisin family serine protease